MMNDPKSEQEYADGIKKVVGILESKEAPYPQGAITTVSGLLSWCLIEVMQGHEDHVVYAPLLTQEATCDTWRMHHKKEYNGPDRELAEKIFVHYETDMDDDCGPDIYTSIMCVED